MPSARSTRYRCSSLTKRTTSIRCRRPWSPRACPKTQTSHSNLSYHKATTTSWQSAARKCLTRTKRTSSECRSWIWSRQSKFSRRFSRDSSRRSGKRCVNWIRIWMKSRSRRRRSWAKPSTQKKQRQNKTQRTSNAASEQTKTARHSSKKGRWMIREEKRCLARVRSHKNSRNDEMKGFRCDMPGVPRSIAKHQYQ